MTMKVKSLVSLALALVLISPAWPALAADRRPDVTKQEVMNLQVCDNAEELNCIEDFKLLEPTPKPLNRLGYLAYLPSTDSNGNLRYHGVEQYEFDGTRVDLWVELQSPQMVIANFDGKPMRGSSLRTYIQAPYLPDHRFEVVIRTSWLKPQDIQLHAVDADYKIESIPGGTRWTFSGHQQTLSSYNSDWSAKLAADALADVDYHRLDFLVHHLGKGGSYFDETCGEEGFTVESHNAPGAGMPFWDEGSRSLNFSISSPHANSQGVPIVGYFRLWMPESYLNCKWPTNTLTAAAAIQVMIQNEDGSYQVASTVVGRKNGMIRVEATGFHFSAPTIKLVGKGMVVKKTLPKFSGRATKLTSNQLAQLRSTVALTRDNTSFTCTGIYRAASNKQLALTRAKAACNAAKRLNPNLKFASQVRQTKVASQDSRVMLSSK
jgi:hypothetical protein